MSQRQFEGQLVKQITFADLSQSGGADVVDPMKLEMEMREIFERIEEGDPTGSPAKNGNLGSQNIVPFTSPTAVDTEKAVEHSLGKVPIAIRPVAPARAGGSFCGSIYNIRDADSTYLYLAVRDTVDTNRSTAVVVW